MPSWAKPPMGRRVGWLPDGTHPARSRHSTSGATSSRHHLQNPQLQLDALEEAGATRIFTDHGISGSTAGQPQLDACLDHLREGDVLTVWKLDRLGRNTQHVLAVVDELTSRGDRIPQP